MIAPCFYWVFSRFYTPTWMLWVDTHPFSMKISLVLLKILPDCYLFSYYLYHILTHYFAISIITVNLQDVGTFWYGHNGSSHGSYIFTFTLYDAKHEFGKGDSNYIWNLDIWFYWKGILGNIYLYNLCVISLSLLMC